MEHIPADNDAVRRPKCFRNVACEIKPLLDKYHRGRDFSHLLLHERNIRIGAAVHLIVLEIRVRSFAAQF